MTMPDKIYAGICDEYGCFWNNAQQITGGEITTAYTRTDLYEALPPRT